MNFALHIIKRITMAKDNSLKKKVLRNRYILMVIIPRKKLQKK